MYTVGTGVAIGQACVLLSAGQKGKRFMTPHATAMLHQPKVPSTGQRQTTELQIKWKEVLDQKRSMLKILAETTGQTAVKIDKVKHRLFQTSYDLFPFFSRIFNVHYISQRKKRSSTDLLIKSSTSLPRQLMKC